MVTNSTPNIFVAGFLLTTSICRFLIFFVFHKKPNQRLYCTVSTINRLSRFIYVPVNCPSGVAHPCNSTHGSTISTHRKTVVTVSPGKYTTKEINRTFKIKVNGLFNGKKINTLVGVSGLIKLVGVEMANKLLRRAFRCVKDAEHCKLRRG